MDKEKRATINPINKKDNNCLQYAVTVALNCKEVKKYLHRITKIKPFINKYRWEGINFPSEKDDWKKIENNNLIIALNVLYATKEKICLAYVSKRRRITLSCSKRTISIIKRNNVKTPW